MLFIKGGEPFFECPQCSFVFQVPHENANFRSSIEDFDSAYRQYLDESPEDEINFQRVLAWMGRFRRIAGKVLDVGAGSGKFVAYLRSKSIEAYGTEPARAVYEHYLLKQPFFFNATVREFAASIEGPRQFEIITAFDVIEHVDDPKDFLRSISLLMKPEGLLFISTPDVGSLCARVFGWRWHFYNKWHLSYLSEEMIAKVATPLGLRLIGSARLGRLRSVSYLLQYFANFVVGKRLRLPTFANRIALPVNLFDTMYLCFKKVNQPAGRDSPVV
jgi:SAM-dependent methyltransferase